MTELPHSDPTDERPGFTPEVLDRTIIAIPLLTKMREEVRSAPDTPGLYEVVVDVNLEYGSGREQARLQARRLITQALYNYDDKYGTDLKEQAGINATKSRLSQQYIFAKLPGEAIRDVVQLNVAPDDKS